MLDTCVRDLSSFDMYQSEIMSGKVSWTPVHNQNFWRENVTKFEDRNYFLIGKLISLLDNSEDPALEVICYDIGEFARYHPDGQFVVQKLGGKKKLMSLLASGSLHSAAVHKQALLAVQKLMVQNWESLQSTGGVAALLKK